MIDIVDEELDVERCTEDVWLTTEGRGFTSRDVVLDQYRSEIKTRVRVDRRLAQRRDDRFTFPDRRFLVFCRNSQAEIAALNVRVDLMADEVIEASRGFQYISQNLRAVIAPMPVLSDDAYSSLVALLETTAVYQQEPNLVETFLTTRSDYIKRAMDVVFKLDDEQRKISWQLPEGPQRIRGLAGTGKTVILSLKAAYAHNSERDFRTLVTFHTQSLYNQFERLISKYYAKEARSTPDWSRLHICMRGDRANNKAFTAFYVKHMESARWGLEMSLAVQSDWNTSIATCLIKLAHASSQYMIWS